ncbi:peptidase T [Staphylococcus massiliensis]|uniref:peptidase T n=1 Tax=Staphylococcus massiliensis TaxID=555791 RepID=UPI001EDD3E48|nr:peptidase T [Staphylococcus massiliensis]MCG3400076.1 peptidase T [Staphylococcus massiliensis]
MKAQITDRLIRYTEINTQSNPDSNTTPSSKAQWDLLHLLQQELKDMGLETTLDDKGYLFATLESNTDKAVPTIGFLAHVDISPDFKASDVKPQVVEQFDGNPITLGNSDLQLTVDQFPELKSLIGHTLVTTDGTTLLGADDKAGIVEIMEAIQYLIQHPEIKHGRIRIGFTPDEEIGKGPHHFDVDAFNADFAYTMDGSLLGELQFESFNAASAQVTSHGLNVHPGSAKDTMINALEVAHQFHAKVPKDASPEFTDGYEGFYHLMSLQGNVEKAQLSYIIRDHDKLKFEDKKKLLNDIVEDLNLKYGRKVLEINMEDQYYNMAEKIKPYPHIIDIPKRVFEQRGITPNTDPIRGGTDGSQLSYMGLPTPNIFTGCGNFHGPYEYASIDVMKEATMVIVGIAEAATQYNFE